MYVDLHHHLHHRVPVCQWLIFFLASYVKTLMGNNDIADALKRLDKLTWEEARTATTEILKVTHSVGDEVNTGAKHVSIC